MNLIKQPPGSNLCGQACVAMIAGISLEQAIKVVGTKGRTRTKQLATALRKLGFQCEERLTRAYRGIYALRCLLKIRWPETNRSHWIVYCKGEFLDPAGDNGWLTGYISSYLEIQPGESGTRALTDTTVESGIR